MPHFVCPHAGSSGAARLLECPRPQLEETSHRTHTSSARPRDPFGGKSGGTPPDERGNGMWEE
eukprot:scaffold215078_cov31-Tisochrysis_lutea.AAC.1